MQIDNALLHTVVFLCEQSSKPDESDKKIPAGTAFLVRLKDKSDGIWEYLITARHNIELAKGPIYIRHNLRGGGFDFIKTQKNDWVTSGSADVACYVFSNPTLLRDTIERTSIPIETFVNHNHTYSGPPLTAASSSPPVRLGDEIAFIGLFSSFPGSTRNAPIMRAGHVAAMPGDPFQVGQSAASFEMTGYLAECRSWGGHSGSPVIWTTTTSSREILSKMMKGPPKQTTVHGLLGLVSAHFDIEQMARISGENAEEVRTAINSGIAAVTPAFEILHLLTRGDVAGIRNEGR